MDLSKSRDEIISVATGIANKSPELKDTMQLVLDMLETNLSCAVYRALNRILSDLCRQCKEGKIDEDLLGLFNTISLSAQLDYCLVVDSPWHISVSGKDSDENLSTLIDWLSQRV